MHRRQSLRWECAFGIGLIVALAVTDTAAFGVFTHVIKRRESSPWGALCVMRPDVVGRVRT
jgi:hypothetical protein